MVVGEGFERLCPACGTPALWPCLRIVLHAAHCLAYRLTGHHVLPNPTPPTAGTPPNYLKSSCEGDGGNGLFVLQRSGPPVVIGVTSYGVVRRRGFGGRLGCALASRPETHVPCWRAQPLCVPALASRRQLLPASTHLVWCPPCFLPRRAASR